MDHESSGWNCFNLYMHDGCVAGYVCNSTTGTCDLGAAGQGDTEANCELACSTDPPPDDQYSCDLSTFTCVKDESGGTSSGTCDSNCADETPAALLGLWRGLNVQTGFSKGEYVMNFSESSAAWGVFGQPSQVVADVASVGPSQLRLTVTSPLAQAGNVLYASYGSPGYPTGPETSSMAIAVQTFGSHQAPPQDVTQAMGLPEDFDVLVLNRCNAWDTQGLCDFSASFMNGLNKQNANKEKKSHKKSNDKDEETPAFLKKTFESACEAFGDCDSCLGGGATCGWCDGQVEDSDGNVLCGSDGNGCCGGDAEFSTCNVAFRKTCPVLCDYVYNQTTDGTLPTCRAATTPEYLDQTTYQDCDAMPWCTTEIYQYCDTDRLECKTLYSTADCEAEPECDVANPTCGEECKQTNYVWCDSVLGCQSTTDSSECDLNPDCDSSNPTQECDPTECVAETFYTCDAQTFTCKPGVGPAPDNSFNTTDECATSCVDKDLSGVWRALAINSGYVGGEWDFALGATSIAWTSPDGTYTQGTYVVGDPIAESSYAAAELAVSLPDGGVHVGVVSNDRNTQTALGPVTQFLYLALPPSAVSVSSFDAGMTDAAEFVLVACLGNGIEVGCDFSSASPKA